MADEKKNEAVENEQPQKKNETQKMVTIKIPLTRQEQADVYVSVNGKSYQIKRGVSVKVPDYVAEVLQHRDDMLAEAMAFEASAAAKD